MIVIDNTNIVLCIDSLTGSQLEKDNQFLTIHPDLEFIFFVLHSTTRLVSQKQCFRHVVPLLKSLLSA